MTQIFKSLDNGSIEHTASTNFFTAGETLEKTMETMDGSGEWESLFGIRLLVDKDGDIIKGPDSFIGKKIDHLKCLSYNDVYQVTRKSIMIDGIVNKSLLCGVNSITVSPTEKSKIEELQNEIEDLIQSRVESSKTTSENRKDPLYRNV